MQPIQPDSNSLAVHRDHRMQTVAAKSKTSCVAITAAQVSLLTNFMRESSAGCTTASRSLASWEAKATTSPSTTSSTCSSKGSGGTWYCHASARPVSNGSDSQQWVSNGLSSQQWVSNGLGSQQWVRNGLGSQQWASNGLGSEQWLRQSAMGEAVSNGFVCMVTRMDAAAWCGCL